jgi:diphthine-ammonia ligase
MCGIIGVIGPNAANLVAKGLTLLKSRGKDGTGMWTPEGVTIVSGSNPLPKSKATIALGHTLHAVVNHHPQPLVGKGLLVTNCEHYKWKEVAKSKSIDASNDADLLLKLLDTEGVTTLDHDSLVFACAYLKDNSLLLARDLFGVKPMWYASSSESFAFASEKKVLESLGFTLVTELNPRHLLRVDVKSLKTNITRRKFLQKEDDHTSSIDELKAKTSQLLEKAIEMRVPNQKVGLLFSGGVDSSVIALKLKQLGVPFKAYVTGVTEEAEDVRFAKRVAKDLDIPLHISTITPREIENVLPALVPLIEDANVVKATVGLTFYLACQEAAKDGCKVVFSGLGSEEIFAGYQRHKRALDVNKECLWGLRRIYERDLYRDDVITMHHGLELRLPFLDRTLAKFSLRIPSSYKLRDDMTKWILRQVALDLGLPEEYAMRKKRAAQYGSKIDHAIGKLAKAKGKNKSDYLKEFLGRPNMKIAALYSGGKDSTLALHIMKEQNYEIALLITIKSENPHSYMFHSPAIDITKLQSESMDIPRLVVETPGEKEEELKDLKIALAQAKEEFRIEGIVTGALYSTYQRDRIEKICDELGLKTFAPLWHLDQESEMREVLKKGFKFILTAVAGDGLTKDWLGREITSEDIDNLVKLNNKIGLNIAGEGGEFESLITSGPGFSKDINIVSSKVVMENKCTGELIISEAKLVPKK